MFRRSLRTLVPLVALVASLVVASPASAANTAHIISAHLADGRHSVHVRVSVTCDPLADNQAALVAVALSQGTFGHQNFVNGFGFIGAVDVNLLTCDGHAHRYTVVVVPNGPTVLDKFRRGPTSSSSLIVQVSTEVSPGNFDVPNVTSTTTRASGSSAEPGDPGSSGSTEPPRPGGHQTWQ